MSQQPPTGNLVLPRTEFIFYGPNVAEQVLPLALSQYGVSRVLLLSTASLVENGVVERVEKALGDKHAGSFCGSVAHTPRNVVLQAAEAAAAAKADALIALGGSSVVDLAKGTAMVLAEGTDFDTLHIQYEPGKVPVIPQLLKPKLPQFAIPTTLSASEYSPGIGLTDKQTGEKHLYMDAKVVPKAVFHDPAICTLTPDGLWASTGMKILSDCLEMVASKRAAPITDMYAFEAVKILIDDLPKSVRAGGQDEDRLASRQRLLYAAYLSLGVAINSSLGLVAGIRHQLGGAHDVPHGDGSTIVLPHVMRWNAAECAPQYARVARHLGLAAGKDDRQATAALIDGIEKLIGQLNIPKTLGEVGIGQNMLMGIAEHVCRDLSIANNPRTVAGAEDVMEVLQAAL